MEIPRKVSTEMRQLFAQVFQNDEISDFWKLFVFSWKKAWKVARVIFEPMRMCKFLFFEQVSG